MLGEPLLNNLIKLFQRRVFVNGVHWSIICGPLMYRLSVHWACLPLYQVPCPTCFVHPQVSELNVNLRSYHTEIITHEVGLRYKGWNPIPDKRVWTPNSGHFLIPLLRFLSDSAHTGLNRTEIIPQTFRNQERYSFEV